MMKGMYGELTKSPNPGTWGISFSILAGGGYSLYFLTSGHEKAGSGATLSGFIGSLIYL